MKKRSQFKKAALISLFATLLAVVIINVASAYINVKADVTQYKRFTLSPTTIDLLQSTTDEVYVKFYLTGDDVPEEYTLIVERAKEMLAEFKDVCSNVRYEFINPFEGKKPEEIYPIMEEFVHKGLIPLPVNRKINAGGQQATTQYIIPGAIVSYKNLVGYVVASPKKRIKRIIINKLNLNYYGKTNICVPHRGGTR